ncbi:MoxR family ATPase (plasmid) [Halorussus limi]|uniref:MoxR family ATPase n=1 Tax=Halorussus limi TaxID=2938695 RepID=A0A8U0I103_9EURY|nr:MoxR family ATPase [Halorussus limi]UPV76839.1 MoxR family ATPase [Halorussus limi]
MNSSEASRRCNEVLDAVSNAVITERETLRTVLSGVLAGGNVLLEDVPGTGKTLTARSLATALGLSFSRIQFTPDLLPADVTGTDVFNERDREFEFDRGPLFANVVLADEINRASPKTQAALLEAMEEGQVTVNGETHQLPDPFFVIATQNPVEDGQGTFPLPEAQKDRFLVKTSLGYPEEEGELELLDRRDARDSRHPSARRTLDPADLREIQSLVERIEVDRDVKSYVVDLARATRDHARTRVGVSPRGTQRLFETARTRALLDGRDYVVPDDVKAVAHPVVAHRLVLTADARVDEVTRTDVVEDLLSEVSVPTIARTA